MRLRRRRDESAEYFGNHAYRYVTVPGIEPGIYQEKRLYGYVMTYVNCVEGAPLDPDFKLPEATTAAG